VRCGSLKAHRSVSHPQIEVNLCLRVGGEFAVVVLSNMRWGARERGVCHGRVMIDWAKLLPPKGFRVLPRRWVVERTFSWLAQNRRRSKDYERLAETSEAFIYAAMTRLIVRRLARGGGFSGSSEEATCLP
jgi:hypothetical protein